MKSKPQLKAVIFDLGGVILHGGYLDFIHQYLGEHLSATTKKSIEFLEHQVNLGKITETQFYKQIEKKFAVHLKPKQMHSRIVEKMTTNRSLVKFIPHIKPAKVAIFSNSIGHLHMEVLKRRHLAGRKLFRKKFFSSVMHLAKPTGASYQYVVKHLKVKPDQALMVDDRPANIAAAKKSGLQGLVFKNTTQFKRDLRKFELVR